MVPLVYSAPVSCPDDVQSQPGLAAAVVLALVADDVRVLTGLHEHAHDGSLVNRSRDDTVRIFELASKGERDPECLCQAALSSLGSRL